MSAEKIKSPLKLKPCPFCGASLFLREDSRGVFYEHGDLPDAPGCIIATLCVELDMLDQWNRRRPEINEGGANMKESFPPLVMYCQECGEQVKGQFTVTCIKCASKRYDKNTPKESKIK
jgi:hypothetical protein